jgi:hypothetical protein
MRAMQHFQTLPAGSYVMLIECAVAAQYVHKNMS